MKSASIIALLGDSGGGKSHYMKTRLAKEKPNRLAVWDFMREYKCKDITESLGEFLDVITQDSFQVAFRPSMDKKVRVKQFDIFCAAVYRVKKLTVVVEELRHVTSPSYAPGNWALITTTGRHKDITVYGTSQRPAHIDKDFFGNCTEIVTYGLTYPNDVDTVAASMGQRGGSELNGKIAALGDYRFIHFDKLNGKKITECKPVT